jgi:hypothetical protein
MFAKPSIGDRTFFAQLGLEQGRGRMKVCTRMWAAKCAKPRVPRLLLSMLSSLALLGLSSACLALTLTFDTAGPLPNGGTYVEQGVVVTSHSDFSSIGDPLGWSPHGNALYFHGAGQYVEVRMSDGFKFDLTSLVLMTNGYTDGRWVETSTGAIQYMLGVHTAQMNFSGPGFKGIEWFRIGTPGYATEVDDIVITPLGPPVDPNPLNTSILAGPAEGAGLDASSVRFSWTGTDDSTAVSELQYSYRMDADSWSAFGPDTAATYAGLLEGQHRFEVKARDASLNQDTTAAYRNFAIDHTPPNTFISGLPESTTVFGNPVNAMVRWRGSDNLTPNGALTYAYRFDGSAYSAFAPDTVHTFASVANGWHTVDVKARDLAGLEDATPLTIHFLAAFGTPVSGFIGADTHWTLAGSPYVVTSDVLVGGNSTQTATLRIDPGVTVRFFSGTRLTIGNFYGAYYSQLGALDARGTPDSAIVFTSNARSPAPGDWNGVTFTDWTNDAATRLDHCVVEYGGQPGGGGLQVDTSAPTITNTTVRYSAADGVRVRNGAGPLMSDCTVTDNDSSGVNIADNNPLPAIANCTLANNGKFGLSGMPQTMGLLAGLAAPGNSRAGIEIRGGFVGRESRWPVAGAPYVVTSDVLVHWESIFNTGNPVLTISPGVQVRFERNVGLWVGAFQGPYYAQPGALDARGTADSTIVFTSNAASPARGDWGGIYFSDWTMDAATRLDHCVVEYGGRPGGGGLQVETSAPPITNTTVRYSAADGVRVSGGAGPLMSDCTVTDNDSSGVNFADNNPLPTIANCTLSNNGKFGLSGMPQTMGLLSGLAAPGNSRAGIEIRGGFVGRESRWPVAGAPYVVTNNVLVHWESIFNTGNPVLTISPGVQVRFERNVGLWVGAFQGPYYAQPGALDARGTADSTIVFTSNAASPARGDWGGIYFSDWTMDAATRLDHCVVEYGGRPGGGGLQVDTSAPTITNTTVRYSAADGVRVSSGVGPLMSSCTVTNNDSSGVNIADNGPLPTIAGCTLSNNGKFGLSGMPQTVGLLSGLGLAGNARAGIEIRGGYVGRESRWPVAGAPYVVTNNVLVHWESIFYTGDARLTISPGVQVRVERNVGLWVGGFQPSYYAQPGALDARGTADSTIVLTSNAASPAPGDWVGIYFSAWTISEQTRLEHCVVDYAGSSGPALDIVSSSPSLTAATVRFSGHDGIRIERYENIAAPKVDQCQISGNLGVGITVTGSSTPSITWNRIQANNVGVMVDQAQPTLKFNVFSTNTAYDIEARAGGTVVARQNYWGPASTGLMRSQPVPANIPAILDNLDEGWRGHVDYQGWIELPALLAASPDSVANSSTTQVLLRGMGLGSGTPVSLSRAGYAEVLPTSTSVLDSTRVLATFDLSHRPLGLWDATVRAAGGVARTLANSLVLGEGRTRLWSEITGGTEIRAGRSRTYIVRFGNSGTVEAGVSWLLLWVPDGFGCKVSYNGIAQNVMLPEPVSDTLWTVVPVTVLNLAPGASDYLLVTLTAPIAPGNAEFMALLTDDYGAVLPDILSWEYARETAAPAPVMIRAQNLPSSDLAQIAQYHRPDGSPLQPGDLIYAQASRIDGCGGHYCGEHVLVYMGDGTVVHQFFGGPASPDARFNLADLETRIFAGYRFYLQYALPAPPGAFTTVAQLNAQWDAYKEDPKRPKDYAPVEDATHSSCVSVPSFMWFGTDIAAYGRFIGPPAWRDVNGDGVGELVYSSSRLMERVLEAYRQSLPAGYLLFTEAPRWRSTRAARTGLTYGGLGVGLNLWIHASSDPNDKAGPAGFASSHAVPLGHPLQYVVNFENAPSASAAAQEITVIDTLSAALDPASLRFTTLQLGEWTHGFSDAPPPIHSVLALNDTTQLEVDVTCNATTHELVMHALGRDTRTNELADILPPDSTPPGGEGFVAFGVSPFDTTTNGTVIRNRASIVFDVNAPVLTNEVSNALDGKYPSSRVTAIADSTAGTSFRLFWQGSDDSLGSGIRAYDVLMAKDGGEVLPWLPGTAETSASFATAGSHLYDFYSVAIDSVGNSESLPTTPDLRVWSADWNFPAPGWYPVGISNRLPSDSLNAIVPVASALTWDPATRSYVRAATLDSIRGYWLEVTNPVHEVAAGPAIGEYHVHLQPGWHLVAGPAPGVRFTSPADNPDSAVVGAYRWDAGSQTYVEADSLLPGAPYWVGVLEACDLSVVQRESATNVPVVQSRNQKLAAFVAAHGALPPLPPAFVLGVQPSVPRLAFVLRQNQPNPFSRRTLVRFTVPRAEHVRIEVFDIAGRRVADLLNQQVAAGEHEVEWDGQVQGSGRQGSGVFFCQMRAGPFRSVRKMILVR